MTEEARVVDSKFLGSDNLGRKAYARKYEDGDIGIVFENENEGIVLEKNQIDKLDEFINPRHRQAEALKNEYNKYRK